jgi:hypothetical protein
MDIRIAAGLAGQIDNVAEFCRREGISRETFYKWQRRFLQHGVPGLQERSRRPNRSPGQASMAVQKLVLDRRERLVKDGLDHGPEAIVWALRDDSAVDAAVVPSRSTVWRILARHGVITAQPQKRPKSATKRFCFTRPNECWQSDWTQWHLGDGTLVAIAGTLDDHSRYLVGLRATPGAADAELVWSVIMAGIDECGIPSMSLTDNGVVYTGRLRGYESVFEINMRALGTHTVNSTPYHPQNRRQNRTILADVEEVATGATRAGNGRRSQHASGLVPQLLQPSPSPPSPPRRHPSGGIHRDRSRTAQRASAAGTRLCHLHHRR